MSNTLLKSSAVYKLEKDPLTEGDVGGELPFSYILTS